MLKLLTITDVAEVLGVSRQRARQLAGLDGTYIRAAGFPPPVATIGKRQQPLYDAFAVRRWATQRVAA